MITRFRALALTAALALAPLPAMAASVQMCQGDVSGASTGSRTIGGANSQVPSSTLYVLNASGCVQVAFADVGWFLSQGFVNNGGGLVSLSFANQTTGFSFTVPASMFIRNIIAQEQFNAAVPGNAIKFGSVFSGASDVATMSGLGLTMAAATDVSIAKRVITANGANTVFVTGQQGTGFGSGSWNFTIELGFF